MTNTYRKKLIEVALPLPEINDASAYDKMPGIGPHPKGIHHWWARLPLPTARAIIFASVVDDPASRPDLWPTVELQDSERERLFDIIRRMMGKKLHDAPEVYAEAHNAMLRDCDGRLPELFDPFSGGGSIPLEANRLGMISHAADLNPVAVLLNKCNLELASRWANRSPINPTHRERIGGAEPLAGSRGLANDLRFYGDLVATRARQAIGELYPFVSASNTKGDHDVVAWIWAHTAQSPNPAAAGKHVPIVSSFVLSTNDRRPAWVEAVIDDKAPDGWRFDVHSGPVSKADFEKAKRGTKAGKAQDFICLLTNEPIQRDYLQSEGKAGRLQHRLMAIVTNGRHYHSPLPQHEAVALQLQNDSRALDARSNLLTGPIPTRAEITGGVCSAYGLKTWGHLLTARQIVALLTLSDLVQAITDDVHGDALSSGLSSEDAAQYAQTVVTFLALAIDRCADFNNALCRWSPSNQKVMNLFGKQALPMVFDFAEANILGTSVGAWHTCKEYVADCVEVLIAGHCQGGTASQRDAASSPSPGKSLLVSTDPPYYNNISYATLSDFFYVWLRRTLNTKYRELFSTVLVPKLPELIASADRFQNDKTKAKEHFESGFRKAFSELRESLDQRFPLTVYYAFKQEDESDSVGRSSRKAGVDLTTGWETLLEALITSGFEITATWPVRASQKWRMVSMGTNALASYIVLACRPRPVDSALATRKEFLNALRSELPEAVRNLQRGNVAPVDMAQAAIGPGMAVFTRFAKVIESDGSPMSVRIALGVINQVLGEVLSEQEGEFDGDSRWALAWFEQFGTSDGPYGVAETLSKAKNTSVKGLEDAGVVKAKGGKVQLLNRSELPEGWNPKTDKRLTVWETTQHLIRTLEKKGEGEAAELMNKLGGLGETARELAYRLYSICERNKWAEEALAYNSLVIAWPELSKLALATRNRQPASTQSELFN
jgi:putative DNA methylase